MQIKFLTLYHAFDDDIEYSKCLAQDNLLYAWRRCIQLKQLDFIQTAKVEFNDYSFFEYPDQDKAREKIRDRFGHKSKKKDGAIEYYWSGTQYPDLDSLYNDLAERKRFMELTIITPDNIDCLNITLSNK